MLNKPLLKTNLKKDISKIEEKLYKALNDKSKGIYNIHKEIDKFASSNIPTGDYDLDEFKDAMWQKLSDEWAKALSKQMISVLSDELSSIISDRIDAYIKTANIIVPLGQAVQVAPSGTGATAAPSSPATIT